jgi:hypothetical protein
MANWSRSWMIPMMAIASMDGVRNRYMGVSIKSKCETTSLLALEEDQRIALSPFAKHLQRATYDLDRSSRAWVEARTCVRQCLMNLRLPGSRLGFLVRHA